MSPPDLPCSRKRLASVCGLYRRPQVGAQISLVAPAVRARRHWPGPKPPFYASFLIGVLLGCAVHPAYVEITGCSAAGAPPRLSRGDDVHLYGTSADLRPIRRGLQTALDRLWLHELNDIGGASGRATTRWARSSHRRGAEPPLPASRGEVSTSEKRL